MPPTTQQGNETINVTNNVKFVLDLESKKYQLLHSVMHQRPTELARQTEHRTMRNSSTATDMTMKHSKWR